MVVKGETRSDGSFGGFDDVTTSGGGRGEGGSWWVLGRRK